MATTPIIVEMLIMGVFASVWMFIFAERCAILQVDQILELLVKGKDWSAAILFVSMAWCYQIGWLINTSCHGFAILFLERRIRNPIFERASLQYEHVRATVYQKASADLRSDLGLDRSVVRLSRAGVLNFLLIGLALLFYCPPIRLISVVSFFFSLLCVLQWRQRYIRYHKRMIEGYRIIIADRQPATKTQTENSKESVA
jgi:hypothetical protein